ncbi:MAG: hypothetical protein KQH83_10040 [Actinobacteria bacterium]|nr:hypothetical protein [Actinomycetota bacterium]
MRRLLVLAVPVFVLLTGCVDANVEQDIENLYGEIARIDERLPDPSVGLAPDGWFDLTFVDDEVWIGVSHEEIEWVIDVDNRFGDEHETYIVIVTTYDVDGEWVDAQNVEEGELLRVRLRGASITLSGVTDGYVRYAFGLTRPDAGE